MCAMHRSIVPVWKRHMQTCDGYSFNIWNWGKLFLKFLITTKSFLFSISYFRKIQVLCMDYSLYCENKIWQENIVLCYTQLTFETVAYYFLKFLIVTEKEEIGPRKLGPSLRLYHSYFIFLICGFSKDDMCWSLLVLVSTRFSAWSSLFSM